MVTRGLYSYLKNHQKSTDEAKKKFFHGTLKNFPRSNERVFRVQGKFQCKTQKAKDKDQKESSILRRQGSFALLRCFPPAYPMPIYPMPIYHRSARKPDVWYRPLKKASKCLINRSKIFCFSSTKLAFLKSYDQVPTTHGPIIRSPFGIAHS